MAKKKDIFDFHTSVQFSLVTCVCPWFVFTKEEENGKKKGKEEINL